MAKLNGWARIVVVVWAVPVLMGAAVSATNVWHELQDIPECRRLRAQCAADLGELSPPAQVVTQEDLERHLEHSYARRASPACSRATYCPDEPATISGVIGEYVGGWAALSALFGAILWGLYVAIAWIIGGFRKPRAD